MRVPKLIGDAGGLAKFRKQIACPCAQGKCFFLVLYCMGSVQSAELPFLVSLSSGVSAPHSLVLFHCEVACLLLTAWV